MTILKEAELKYRKVLLSFLFLTGLFFGFNVHAQEDDAQLRLGAGIGSDLSESFSWGADIQQRFNNNIERFDQFLVEPSINYSFAKYFRLSAGYRFIMFQDLVDGYDFKQRANIDLRARLKWDLFSFKYRTRFQYGFDETLNLRSIYAQKLVNRNLVEVAYSIYGSRFKPYTSAELFYYINPNKGGYITKYRIEVGTDIYINNKSGLTAYFMYEPEVNVVYPITSFIYGLKYNFSLK